MNNNNATESILLSIKNMLHIHESVNAFDDVLIAFINMSFSNLHQLGVGPDTVFFITNADTTWAEFYGDDSEPNLAVQTYIYLKTKMGFDPPASATVQKSYENMISEQEFRLLTYYELREVII